MTLSDLWFGLTLLMILILALGCFLLRRSLDEMTQALARQARLNRDLNQRLTQLETNHENQPADRRTDRAVAA